MFNLLFSTDPKQSLRMMRHLAAMLSLMAFTLISVYFYYNHLFSIDRTTFTSILVFFWCGVFSFTFLIRSGLNEKFVDPSLTIPQLLWGTSFLLAMIYLLNEWRALMLMAFFGMFSFGFFRLKFREFLSVGLFAILGYTLVLLYIFIEEPERINVELELAQLLAFSCTILVMLYTGSSIQRLRDRAKRQYVALQDALDVNRKLATTDDLTSLYNRRYFMEKLSQQKALSERDKSDFVVIYCDLDHFKHINDTFGHHTGDIVLKKFAEILRSNIREIDYAARFGGEEFVGLLINTDLANAIKVTERIRESLASYNFNDIAPSLRATVSIGIANFQEFSTIQETLMSADNRMYRAKEQGRNQVVYTDDSAK